MTDNKHLPAYPQPIYEDNNGAAYTTIDYKHEYSGLSKREKIAAMCLQGILAHGSMRHLGADATSQQAIIHADSLLIQLQNTEK